MRVLQLIDSLRSGGAEQMAVAYANALVGQINSSYLCCTRYEGVLIAKISEEIGYLFLNKKNLFDVESFKKLRDYVIINRIDIIQAHGTSWFMAVLIKISLPKIKLIWHDHYGKDLKQRNFLILKLCSRFFDGVISVNDELKEWSLRTLQVKNVRYFKNFLPEKTPTSTPKLCLKGNPRDYKIICVANFRPQKDHLNLLQAFYILLGVEKQVSLHLIGKVHNDSYSDKIMAFIANKKLDNKVYVYGEIENAEELLLQADLCVLSSASEGLPVSLLEYARAGLPVVATKVGEIPEVVGENAILVPPGKPNELATALQTYIENPEKSRKASIALKQEILSLYSEVAVIPGVVEYYRSII